MSIVRYMHGIGADERKGKRIMIARHPDNMQTEEPGRSRLGSYGLFLDMARDASHCCIFTAYALNDHEAVPASYLFSIK